MGFDGASGIWYKPRCGVLKRIYRESTSIWIYISNQVIIMKYKKYKISYGSIVYLSEDIYIKNFTKLSF